MKKANGFTIIEVLVAFSIFLLIASVIPQFIKTISFEPKLLQRLETSIFFQQFVFDVQKSGNVYADHNSLYLQQDNEIVTYAYFQQKIRRQVNGKGHEIVLQNVSNVEFSEWNNGIDVKVEDIYNQTFKRRIKHLLPLDKMYAQ